MAVTFRTQTVPRDFDARLKEAAHAVLAGNWRITALQGHLRGLWNVQFEGPQRRYRVVFSSLETVSVPKLVRLMTLMTDPTCSVRDTPIWFN